MKIILDKPILIMGLPGAGKSVLATALSKQLKAVHWNADEVRTHLNKDLGFSLSDRIEQARRMRFLCDVVLRSGKVVIADFVCPTKETIDAFGEAFIVFVDRIKECRYADTNALFEYPDKVDVVIPFGLTIEEEVDLVMEEIVRRGRWG